MLATLGEQMKYNQSSGNMKYLFAMMDDETRFWIAQEVAETKFKHDARIPIKPRLRNLWERNLKFHN